MRVEVDTHDRNGAVLVTVPPSAEQTPVYDEAAQVVDKMIDDIVSANSKLPKATAP